MSAELPAGESRSSNRYEDTVVKYMCLKDTNGKFLFAKQDQDIVVMMGAYYYDHKGRQTRYLSAHSNVGFDVWENVFDSAGNEIEVYGYEEILAEKSR